MFDYITYNSIDHTFTMGVDLSCKFVDSFWGRGRIVCLRCIWISWWFNKIYNSLWNRSIIVKFIDDWNSNDARRDRFCRTQCFRKPNMEVIRIKPSCFWDFTPVLICGNLDIHTKLMLMTCTFVVVFFSWI